MPCLVTHTKPNFSTISWMCVSFHEVGVWKVLRKSAPAEEPAQAQLENKGGSQESNRRDMARKDSVIFCLRFSPNTFLGNVWGNSMSMCS